MVLTPRIQLKISIYKLKEKSGSIYYLVADFWKLSSSILPIENHGLVEVFTINTSKVFEMSMTDKVALTCKKKTNISDD